MMLHINKIYKKFGGVKALNDCTFGIEQGKITALIGPNGSGKTTAFNVISRIIPHEKGTISFAGINITKTKDFKVARKGISRTFQQVRLFKNLTIREHIEIALGNGDEELFQNIFKKKKNYDHRIREILELVNLDKPLSTYAIDLSYGQRKLLDLAIAIAKPHHVLMLDEPVAGVNPKLRKQIKQILKKLNKKGETVFLIEHDMNFVMDLAHKIFVLDHGTVIAEGKPKQIQNNRKVLDAYLGE